MCNICSNTKSAVIRGLIGQPITSRLNRSIATVRYGPVLGGGGAGDVACPLAAGSVGRKAAIQHIRCHEQVVLVEFVAAL
jgi:hypothetical protein